MLSMNQWQPRSIGALVDDSCVRQLGGTLGSEERFALCARHPSLLDLEAPQMQRPFRDHFIGSSTSTASMTSPYQGGLRVRRQTAPGDPDRRRSRPAPGIPSAIAPAGAPYGVADTRRCGHQRPPGCRQTCA